MPTAKPIPRRLTHPTRRATVADLSAALRCYSGNLPIVIDGAGDAVTRVAVEATTDGPALVIILAYVQPERPFTGTVARTRVLVTEADGTVWRGLVSCWGKAGRTVPAGVAEIKVTVPGTSARKRNDLVKPDETMTITEV